MYELLPQYWDKWLQGTMHHGGGGMLTDDSASSSVSLLDLRGSEIGYR